MKNNNDTVIKTAHWLLFIPSKIAEGYVFTVLWGWFVVPTFNLPELSIPFALGICLVTSISTKSFRVGDIKSHKNAAMLDALVLMIMKPIFFLGTGYIYLQFI